MSGYEYGNTRLRARLGRLLTRADYAGLLATADLSRMLGVLSEGPYGPDVEAALPRAAGLARLDEAIRSHLGRQLREMRSFYSGPAGEAVDLLLDRWDVRNLVVLLRSAARPGEAGALLPLLIPAGSLDAPALRTLAAQPGARAMVDLAVAWSLPDRATARHLLATAAASGDDPATLEHALLHRHAAWLAEVLAGRPDDALTRVLQAETDARNLSAALRTRAARLDGEPAPEDWVLPGGRVAPETWLAATAVDDPAGVVALLAGRLPAWEAALRAWAADGDPARLSDRLDDALALGARAEMAGDPLGPAVPAAFTLLVEQEARRLRLVGRALAHGLDPDEVDGRLGAA